MKTIILRLDLNVPIDEKGKITETERIDKIIGEVKRLSNKNKLAILSHLGKGEVKDSLRPIEKYLRLKLTKKENSNITILENVRFWKGETAKENSKEWKKVAKYFAGLGDEYIDDAFASMHRAHASIVGIPSMFKKESKKVSLGELSKIEIKNLNKTLKLTKDPKNKTLLILSGAKISTKLPLIRKFLDLKAKVFVGGGLANQILKEVLQLNIGKSFTEEDFNISKKEIKILSEYIKEEKLLLPIDFILKNKKVELAENNKIKNTDCVADIGPASVAILKNELRSSKNIIMNGPLGIYEQDFSAATLEILKSLKKEEKSGTNILIGGGDTLVLTKKLKMSSNKNIFISTGGGAMLDFLANDGKLPGIEVIYK